MVAEDGSAAHQQNYAKSKDQVRIGITLGFDGLLYRISGNCTGDRARNWVLHNAS